MCWSESQDKSLIVVTRLQVRWVRDHFLTGERRVEESSAVRIETVKG